jgi:hypothetical protein
VANTGNIFPGTGENNAGIGATAWTNPGDVVSDNATDATCNAPASSQYLVARNFNFSGVPTNATITGILVRVEASEHTGGTEPLLARLQDASGALVGTGKSTSNEGSISGTTKAVYTYGSTSDTWAASPTGNMVHDADFGVRLWFTTVHDIRIDYVTMALEYTVAVPGIGVETDTALAVTVSKAGTIKIAAETDTALGLAVSKSGTIKIAVETDTALALALSRMLTPGVAVETDTALALSLSGGGLPMGTAIETDSALALALTKTLAAGIAAETDSALALALSKRLSTGIAVESDTALSLTLSRTLAVGIAVETDTALALAWTKTIAMGLAIETDSAVARPLLGYRIATETDTALALALSGAGYQPRPRRTRRL